MTFGIYKIIIKSEFMSKSRLSGKYSNNMFMFLRYLCLIWSFTIVQSFSARLVLKSIGISSPKSSAFVSALTGDAVRLHKLSPPHIYACKVYDGGWNSWNNCGKNSVGTLWRRNILAFVLEFDYKTKRNCTKIETLNTMVKCLLKKNRRLIL